MNEKLKREEVMKTVGNLKDGKVAEVNSIC